VNLGPLIAKMNSKFANFITCGKKIQCFPKGMSEGDNSPRPGLKPRVGVGGNNLESKLEAKLCTEHLDNQGPPNKNCGLKSPLKTCKNLVIFGEN